MDNFNFIEFVEALESRRKRDLLWGEEGHLPVGWKCVDQFGGEGKGDDIWAVFTDGSKYFKVYGWYASSEGADYSGVVRVYPKQKTITVYEDRE